MDAATRDVLEAALEDVRLARQGLRGFPALWEQVERSARLRGADLRQLPGRDRRAARSAALRLWESLPSPRPPSPSGVVVAIAPTGSGFVGATGACPLPAAYVPPGADALACLRAANAITARHQSPITNHQSPITNLPKGN
jgi:hypothetical protein